MRDSKGRFIKGVKMPKDLAKKSAKARTKYTAEELKEHQKQWVQDNIQRVYAKQKEWRDANIEKVREANKKSKQKNKSRVLATNNKRRAEKINRTPSWLSEDDINEMKKIYAIAQRKSEIEGREYHVDHIIPLKGKYVSGLHVPNNLQIITATENMKKNNKFEGDVF